MTIRKALVVDDSRVARFSLAKLLRTRGIEVDMAESGRDALEYLRTTHPDVVFMDYMMPEMNGLEAMRAITGNPQTASVPVVFCTGNDTPEDRKKAEQHGAANFMTKGNSEGELDDILRSLQQNALSRRAANQANASSETGSAATSPKRGDGAAADSPSSPTSQSEEGQALEGGFVDRSSTPQAPAEQLQALLDARAEQIQARLESKLWEAWETVRATTVSNEDGQTRARLTRIEQRLDAGERTQQEAVESAVRASQKAAHEIVDETRHQATRQIREEIAALERRLRQSETRTDPAQAPEAERLEKMVRSMAEAQFAALLQSEKVKLTDFATRTVTAKAEEVTAKTVAETATRVAAEKAREVALSAAEEVTFNTVETAREVSVEEMRELREGVLNDVDKRIVALMRGKELNETVSHIARTAADKAGSGVAERVAEQVSRKLLDEGLSRHTAIVEARSNGLYRRTVFLSVSVLVLAVIANIVSFFI